MNSLRPIEPYTVVTMHAGERAVPPFVALGTTDVLEAERQARVFVRERYPGEDHVVVVGVDPVGNGQASRTRTI